MKLQSPLRIFVAAALLTLLGACATMTSGPAALAGTWTNSLGTVWTINADGTFHVMSIKTKAEVRGNYTVAGDTITNSRNAVMAGDRQILQRTRRV